MLILMIRRHISRIRKWRLMLRGGLEFRGLRLRISGRLILAWRGVRVIFRLRRDGPICSSLLRLVRVIR